MSLFRSRSEVDDRLDDHVGGLVAQAEAELLADVLHLVVLGEDLGRDALERLVAADLDEAAEELGAEPLALEAVDDEEGELGLVDAVELPQAADAEDLLRRR